MKHAKLLDCTLRDGAYLVDKEFGDNVIKAVIEGLTQAKTDIIEIGFLQNEGAGDGKTVFFNNVDARKYIPQNKENTMFAVMADYSRYSVENLDVNNGQSFDIVRVCFFKHERFDAINFFKSVKEKGYKLFIQPVDILGYSDAEIIEFLELINPIEPYCLSIVDTFGSMYAEDLQRIFCLINHNLHPQSHIGFHSHNNMQLSNALAQEFYQISLGKRNVVIDTTLSGMGRGAGNTPTELVAQYLVSQKGYHYDIDIYLDLIDIYIDLIRVQASWGYNTHMFLAGAYGAHVNNIAYLKDKNSIRSKDIRYIFNKMGSAVRKRYYYDLLEEAYLDSISAEIDDTETLEKLKCFFTEKNVLIIAPGKTVKNEIEIIEKYIEKNAPLIVAINYIPKEIKTDFLYMNNVNRFEAYQKSGNKYNGMKIFASNLPANKDENTYIVSFNKLYKCGWSHSDNSTILLLRLLDKLSVKKIGIAGLDGYDEYSGQIEQYAESSLEKTVFKESAIQINQEIREMLDDFLNTKKSHVEIEFVTTSRFSKEI